MRVGVSGYNNGGGRAYIIDYFIFEKVHLRKGNGRNNDKFHLGKVR